MTELEDYWTIDRLEQTLEPQIKGDRTYKLLALHGLILNYTKAEQVNLIVEGEPSSGKTYVMNILLDLFPHEDVIKYAKCSPTSFFHKVGVLVDANENPILNRNSWVESKLDEWKQDNPQISPETKTEYKNKTMSAKRNLKTEYDQLTVLNLVDLRNKIIFLYDQQNNTLIEQLRPLLSQDDSDIDSLITDRTTNGSHRSKQIRLKGPITLTHCSTFNTLDAQESTRAILLSPEKTQNKLNQSVPQVFQEEADLENWKKKAQDADDWVCLRHYILQIKSSNFEYIKYSNEIGKYAQDVFRSGKGSWTPRDQRDARKFIRIAKARTLMNYHNRKIENNVVWMEIQDIDDAYEMMKDIMVPTQMGLSPEVWDFYIQAIKDQENLTLKDINSRYMTAYQSMPNRDRIRGYLYLLEEKQVILQEPDPEDKRRWLVSDNLTYGTMEELVKNPDELMREGVMTQIISHQDSHRDGEYDAEETCLGFSKSTMEEFIVTPPPCINPDER